MRLSKIFKAAVFIHFGEDIVDLFLELRINSFLTGRQA